MTEYEYKYFVPADGETIEDAYVFTTTWSPECAEYVAEDAAEGYHDDGGWEATWPITFELWTADGAPMGRFKVECEAVPSFSATKVAEPGGDDDQAAV